MEGTIQCNGDKTIFWGKNLILDSAYMVLVLLLPSASAYLFCFFLMQSPVVHFLIFVIIKVMHLEREDD